MYEQAITFFKQNNRQVPWRKTHDPYAIWVSEIMCQQTQLETVIPYFNRFMEAFPTVEDLANSDEEVLMKYWQGLGYYSRARNLRKAAQIIVADHQGKLPADYDQLISLPGIGDYTACAILSMAYDQPYPAVDGNFLRVFSRLYKDEHDIGLPTTKKQLKAALKPLMVHDSGAFNQAIMDIGATICLANTTPLCDKCPFRQECLSYRDQSYLDYPVNSRKTAVRQLDYTIFIIKLNGDTIVLRKRPEKGLLASLYEFPNVMGKMDCKQVEALFPNAQVETIGSKIHHFSHQTWNMTAYRVNLNEYALQEREILASLKEVETVYSIPKAFNQFISDI